MSDSQNPIRFTTVIATLLCFSSAIAATAAAAPHVGPRAYDLKNVEWHLTLHPESSTIDGDVINTVHLLAAQESVKFDCGPLTISAVSVNGVRTSSVLQGEVLTVGLPDKGQARDYKVEITYHGKPTGGVYFVGASTSYPAHTPVVYSQGAAEDNRYWLPTYDFPDNKATSEGYITVPKGWKALSNGRLLEEKTVADQTTIHWKMDQPHSTYLISFVAGPLDVGREKWGRMPVEYWVPQGLEDWGKASFGGTNKIIDFYSKQLGVKYPYAKFAQAAVPEFMFGGMENITCVTQSIQALFPPSEAALRNSTGLIAHELAHQWFGDLVTCADWEHTWINEGFATFMPPFYQRVTQGEEAFEAEREVIFHQEETNRNPHPIAWKGFNYPSDIYRGQIYSGGASRMYMLMYKLGEPQFWKGIHDFLETYKFQPVTTEEFFASMSKSCGLDLTPFMNDWMFTVGVPHVGAKADGSDLVFTESAPYRNIEPDVWIWDGVDWLKKQLKFTAELHECRLNIGDKLASAPFVIDPEGHLLVVQTTPTTMPPDQAAAMIDKLPAFSKSNILRSFNDQPAVVRLLDEPRNRFYREALIGRLDKTNVELLDRLLSDSDPKLRYAALTRVRVMRLAQPGTPLLTTLGLLEKTDRLAAIREGAYELVMSVSDDKSMAEKAWTTDDFGDRYRLAALNWWASHDKIAAREHSLEALDKSLSEPVQLSAIRILGTLGDARGEHTVYNHLVAVLRGTAYRQRSSAMSALVEYGDKRALVAIEPLTHESLFFTREAAERAYSALSDAQE